MMHLSRSTSLALPLLLALSGSGFAAPLSTSATDQRAPASAPQELAQSSMVIVAPSAPPPPREEQVPPPPPSAVTTVWETGHWNWTGSEWVWVHGQYIQAPAAQTAWEPGHWLQQPNGWLWVEGHWR